MTRRTEDFLQYDLREAISSCMDDADQMIEQYINEEGLFQRFSSVSYELFLRLKRARKEFDSKMFFVVIYGPVKSGKSTLTNSFARQYVSPSKFGVECTARPSFIIQANESALYEYFPNVQNVDEKKYFDLVVDYLRGITSEEELKKYIHVERHALTKSIVEKKLASDIDKKPLITVVKVQGGEFISPGIAIIDMPGLDGKNCNIQDTPIFKWFLEKTDFLIFVQSSMAAINIETAKFLEALVSQSKNPPTWLIQNMIDAKYWRPLEERMNETNSQLLVTKKELVKLINPPEKDIDATAINLGKAYDGIENDDLILLEESGFKEFEHKLKHLLETKRVLISEKNSLNGMLKTVNDMIQQFHDIKSALVTENKQIDQIKQVFEQAILLIHTITYNNTDIHKYTSSLKVLVDSTRDKLLENLLSDVGILKGKVNFYMLGSQFNNVLKEFCSDEIKKANLTYFNRSSVFGNTLVNEINESIASMEAPFIQRLSDKLKEFNQLIDEYSLDLSPISVDMVMLPKLNPSDLKEVFTSSFDIKQWLVPERILLIEKKYNGGQNIQRVDHMHDSFSEYLKSSAAAWLDNTSINIYNSYCESRRINYKAILEEMKQEKELEWDMALNNNRNIIMNFENALSNLKNLQEHLKITIGKYTL